MARRRHPGLPPPRLEVRPSIGAAIGPDRASCTSPVRGGRGLIPSALKRVFVARRRLPGPRDHAQPLRGALTAQSCRPLAPAAPTAAVNLLRSASLRWSRCPCCRPHASRSFHPSGPPSDSPSARPRVVHVAGAGGRGLIPSALKRVFVARRRLPGPRDHAQPLRGALTAQSCRPLAPAAPTAAVNLLRSASLRWSRCPGCSPHASRSFHPSGPPSDSPSARPWDVHRRASGGESTRTVDVTTTQRAGRENECATTVAPPNEEN